MKEKIIKPRGTADVIPSEIYKWQYVEKNLHEVASLFGFSEIRFPTFEHTELFNRGVGETTDVVQKEMYTFQDNGGRSLSLRPEGTASTVRAYLENSLYALSAPFKAYYIAPNFRYEKPQAGRYREHHQFGIELLGSYSPYADAEIITLANTFLNKFGITNVKLNINTLGCPECRPAYKQALIEYFEGYKDTLCTTCLSRLEKNPLRILDCKSDECKEIAKNAPKTIDFICHDCSEHFQSVQNELDLLGIAYEIDTGIVRGLDYYTRTVFEFVSQIGTVCGGGRYDKLVEELGGQPTGAIGFGCGVERLIYVMENSNCSFGQPKYPKLFIATADESGIKLAHTLTDGLRKLGVPVIYDMCGRSLKAQMKYADKTGAYYSMVIGGLELETGKTQIRKMSDGTTAEIELLVEKINEYLAQ